MIIRYYHIETMLSNVNVFLVLFITILINCKDWSMELNEQQMIEIADRMLADLEK